MILNNRRIWTPRNQFILFRVADQPTNRSTDANLIEVDFSVDGKFGVKFRGDSNRISVCDLIDVRMKEWAFSVEYMVKGVYTNLKNTNCVSMKLKRHFEIEFNYIELTPPPSPPSPARRLKQNSSMNFNGYDATYDQQNKRNFC